MKSYYSKIFLLIIPFFLSLFFGGQISAEAQSKSDVSVQLLVEGVSFSSPQAVLVRIIITNNTAKDLRILSWYTPDNGILEPLFNVTRNGESSDYLGALYKRPDPTEQDYIKLAAGKSVEYIVDLSKYYSFIKSGTYVVQYRVSSKDLYGINIEGDLISNELSLEVSGRIDPLLKIIQPEIVSGNTTFNACSASQQTALLTARADASTYAETAKNYLVNNRAGALYQLWFGVYDIARYNKAKSHFNLISNAIDTVTVNFDCTCTDPFYAYVYPSSPYNIYLCNSFWSASATGTDSKAGTLIHEMSHFIVLGGTDDYIYGKNGAKSLAISNPANAVMNADNHEYFAENTPPTADNAAAYTLNEISYNFGIQASGSSSISHTFTLTSTGDVNLAIGQLAVTTEFILIDDLCSNNSIGMGNACTFKISFAPSSTGIKNGTVTIPSNSIIENNISLSGIGTVSTSVTISGSTGASGVALSYMDGTPKTVTSDANGNYSFTVPVGWSGTVTPAHSCYTSAFLLHLQPGKP